MDAADKRMLEREALRNMIQQWNANRLDLFELSEPNENLEFHGVMRFYFQDSGQKIATKCIRVASDATVSDVIETLIEKFRPDMRMLSLGSYSLWETHGPDDERRLEPHEKPLLVQLNWHADDREGRFLLKCLSNNEVSLSSISEKSDQNFKRKLSKREKKELKKKEKLSRLKSDTNDENRPAEKLYTELPETSFTRSISNPEAVMRRRRQQKLERKLQQFRSKDGGPDTGGTLKIYGASLSPHVPYKTLLLSVRDTAAGVLREMLDKYGLAGREPQQYCLVQVDTTDNSEYVLEDDECPLAIVMTHHNRSSIMFHVRRRPADAQPRRRKKKAGAPGGHGGRPGSEPTLVEVAQADGTTLENGRRVRINDVIEVGSGNGTALQLYGPSIQPRHCVIAPCETGGYTVTPLHADAQVFVNGRRVAHTQRLQHGCLLKFGRVSTFRFLDPAQETIMNRNLSQGQNFGSGSIYDRMSAHVTSSGRPPQEAILPAVLEFPEAGQAQFLSAVITRLDPHAPAFKLAPVYTLYLCARYRASTHYRPELTPTERAHKLTAFLHHVATLIHGTVQERCTDSAAQAFWMANASELLHFLKSDRHISSFSTQAQELLPTTVQNAFSNIVTCFQEELSRALVTLNNPRVADANEATAPTLQTLAAAMVLLRQCRVNAALTIQLFSHLFHYINAVCFNKLVSDPSSLTARWGAALAARLALVASWAERQGLEIAADCHLARTHQAALLIQGEYNTAEAACAALTACYKLNSVQVRALLTRAPSAVRDAAVAHAAALADELARADLREIRLEESTWLGAALLIPGDGFSAEVVRGVPPGLAEFAAPLQRAGLCRLAPQPAAAGSWAVYLQAAGLLEESFLDDGFLLNKKVGVHQPKRIENANILIANTPMDTDKIKVFGSTIKVDSMAKIAELEVAEKEKMKDKVNKILNHKCNVFINRQLIYNYPEQLFADAGVMAIEHADFDGIERLALVTGGEICSTFDSPERVKLGHCKVIEQVLIGDECLIRFSGIALGAACTVVIRGATQQVIDEAERSLHDALCVLAATVKEPKVIYGGGASEMLMAEAASLAAARTPGKEAAAAEAFAVALRRLPAAVADNAGYDSAELVARLRASHAQGENTMGLDMEKGTVGDMKKLGITESYVVKRQVLVSAAEAAEVILRVDNILKSAPRRRGPDRRPC